MRMFDGQGMEIDAPRHKVFEFLRSPENLPRWAHAFVSAGNGRVRLEIAGAHEGTVEDIQTRATFIRTYDGRRVVIPNAELFTDTVVVNTAFEHHRLEYDSGIGYGDDVDRARGVILHTVRSTERVLAESAPDVLLMDFALSSANLRVRW